MLGRRKVHTFLNEEGFGSSVVVEEWTVAERCTDGPSWTCDCIVYELFIEGNLSTLFIIL